MLKENKKFNNRIDLLYYDEKDEYAEMEVKKYIDNVYYLDLRKKGKSLRIMSMLKGIPYGIYQYDESRLYIKNGYDKIIFDQPLSMNLISNINTKESILMAYDSMSLYFGRKSKIDSTTFIEKIYNKMQSKYYKKIQKKLYSKFNKVFFVSENDASYEKEMYAEFVSKIDNITLGVDYNKFDSSRYSNSSSKNIIFTGIMDYPPNKDAAIFFATKIFPKIIEKDNEVKFIIVGKNSDKDICNLISNNIKVTGFVDDIVESIASARVYVSPLRFGTGMKNKVLEAMSCKRAIVASETSVEGISQLEHNKNIYIPTTEDEWVYYVVKVLNDNTINDSFGNQCRKIILTNYSWENAYVKVFNK
ncbi:glycosyltransferase [Clostridium chromiireducens]|uniref:Glycosyltransferase n=2 Tax=Clostridium chromiireducens TaxID=225345 RepID=A0A399IS49_9CLOT|nr:glycosyltransferase [Clostridium chromiireducens]